jgi:hypothetical protein
MTIVRRRPRHRAADYEADMLLLLSLLSPALALTSQQSGPSLDLAAGLGLRGAPVSAALGGDLSLGWWIGTYDDQYAFGKYWWLGASGRVDWRPDALGITPMVEVRRGLELFVVGVAPFVGAGPVLSVVSGGGDVPVGLTGRAGVMVKMRRTRFLGISLRLEAGADVVGGSPSFAGGALFGVSWARPASAITAPEI